MTPLRHNCGSRPAADTAATAADADADATATAATAARPADR